MGELTLIYYEAFVSEADAREREGYLKTTKGKRTVKLMLKDTMARSSRKPEQSTVYGPEPYYVEVQGSGQRKFVV